MKTNSVMAAPKRLQLLLPWLNGDHGSPGMKLNWFLAESVQAWGDSTQFSHSDDRGFGFAQAELDDLRRVLLEILDMAEQTGEGRPWRRLESLEFGVIRQREKPAKLPRGASERREALKPGAFGLAGFGNLLDILVYAFMRTLTEPGTVLLSRCPAPAPGDWSRICGRYLISGGRVGRPQEYCSDACRVRTNRRNEAEANKRRS